MTTRIPITCEARLMGLSKTRRKDGDWVEVKFHIHPDDHPAALFILPLGTDCELSIKGVEEAEQDTTASLASPDSATPAPVKGGRRAKMAGRLCGEPAFQSWFFAYAENDWPPNVDREEYTARTVRAECDVESRAELDHNETAGQIWDHLERNYRNAQQGITEPDLQRQANRGE